MTSAEIRAELDRVEAERVASGQAARRLQLALAKALRFERAMDPQPASVFERGFHEAAREALPAAVYQRLVDVVTGAGRC